MFCGCFFDEKWQPLTAVCPQIAKDVSLMIEGSFKAGTLPRPGTLHTKTGGNGHLVITHSLKAKYVTSHKFILLSD